MFHAVTLRFCSRCALSVALLDSPQLSRSLSLLLPARHSLPTYVWMCSTKLNELVRFWTQITAATIRVQGIFYRIVQAARAALGGERKSAAQVGCLSRISLCFVPRWLSFAVWVLSTACSWFQLRHANRVSSVQF